MTKRKQITDLTKEWDSKTIFVVEPGGLAAADLAAAIEKLQFHANDVLFVATLDQDVAAQLKQFVRLAVHDKRQTERLVDAMFTRSNTVSPAAASQAQRNAEARQALVDEFGLHDSEQIAQMAGSTARNRSATASRWLADGRIFAVEHLGTRLYPTFQFDADGRPKPIIKRVLQAFSPYGLGGWEIALWFTTASGWLNDHRPVDQLATAPDDVAEAARHTFEEVAA